MSVKKLTLRICILCFLLCLSPAVDVLAFQIRKSRIGSLSWKINNTDTSSWILKSNSENYSLMSVMSLIDSCQIDSLLRQSPAECILSRKNLHMNDEIQPIAFKTNLLFDLATALNVEIEVPLARRWSIAAEWMFPWWLDEKNQNCLQVLSGTIEGKYWFSRNRKEMRRNDLTGWFAGVYAGGGIYDIEWHKKGYQGEFYLAAGVSIGFAHKIGPNLSLEYGIGVGYLETDYRKYRAQQDQDGKWILLRQKRGSYSYFGPTKVKVSLVWRPSFYMKREKGAIR